MRRIAGEYVEVEVKKNILKIYAKKKNIKRYIHDKTKTKMFDCYAILEEVSLPIILSTIIQTFHILKIKW